MIAAVNGLCLGYGLTLMTWCDIVIASDRATFGYPEVKLGVPTIVGALRLPQRIGWQPAMELLLTGETISAARAKEIGLALQVVEHGDVLSAAGRFAERLLAGAPLAQRAVKEVAAGAPDVADRRHPLRRDDAAARGRDRRAPRRGRRRPGRSDRRSGRVAERAAASDVRCQDRAVLASACR